MAVLPILFPIANNQSNNERRYINAWNRYQSEIGRVAGKVKKMKKPDYDHGIRIECQEVDQMGFVGIASQASSRDEIGSKRRKKRSLKKRVNQRTLRSLLKLKSQTKYPESSIKGGDCLFPLPSATATDSSKKSNAAVKITKMISLSRCSSPREILSNSFDFSYSCLSSGDVFLVCESLQCNPDASSVNLSGNTMSSVQEFERILLLLEKNQAITEIIINDCEMSQKCIQQLQNAAQANLSYQIQIKQKQAQQDFELMKNEWRDERLQSRISTSEREKIERSEIQSAYYRLMRHYFKTYKSVTKNLIARIAWEIQKKKTERLLLIIISEERKLRLKTFKTYLRSCCEVIELLDEGWRTSLEAEYTTTRITLRKKNGMSWREAKSRERHRFHLEELARLDMEKAELIQRSVLEEECETQVNENHDWHINHWNWVSTRHQTVVLLMKEETEERYRLISEGRSELKFIFDRKRLVEQQREITLMQQRRGFCTNEERAREKHEREEEIMRPIIADCLLSYIKFARIKSQFSDVSAERSIVVGELPTLNITTTSSELISFPRCVLLQKDCHWTAAQLNSFSITTSLSEEWSEGYSDILTRGISNVTEQQQQASTQLAINAKHRTNAHTYPDREFMIRILDTIEKEIGPKETNKQKPPENKVKWPEADTVRNRKLTIWGGEARFTIKPTNDSEDAWDQGNWLMNDATPGIEPVNSCELIIPLNSDGSTTLTDIKELIEGIRYRSDRRECPRSYPIIIETVVDVKFAKGDIQDSYFHLHNDVVEEVESNVPLPQSFDTVTVCIIEHVINLLPSLCHAASVESNVLVKWKEGCDKGRQLVDEVRTHDPAIVSKNKQGEVVVADGNGTGITHFGGGKLIVEFTEGYTEHDHVVLRSMQPVTNALGMTSPPLLHYSDCDNIIRVRDSPAAIVTEGVLLSKVVDPSESVQPRKNGGKIILNLFQPPPVIVTAEIVKRIVERLRYHNTTKDPVPGERKITLSLVDERGSISTIEIDIEVEAHDDPAELKLVKNHLLYHAGCGYVPEDIRLHMQKMTLTLFRDATLIDPDTEHFVGGSVQITLTQMQRGDTLHLEESAFVVPSEMENDRIYVSPTNEVFHNSNIIGKISFHLISESDIPKKKNRMLGIVNRAQEKSHSSMRNFNGLKGLTDFMMSKSSPDAVDETSVSALGVKNYKGITLKFTEDGNATIDSAEAFLRTVVYYNGQSNISTATTRLVDLKIRLGPTLLRFDNPQKQLEELIIEESKMPEIGSSVSIKATPSLISVHSKFSILRYTKGSGPRRLSSFELLHDQYIDNYEGGSIIIDMIEGYCQGEDSIDMRELDSVSCVLKEWVSTEQEIQDIVSGKADQSKHLANIATNALINACRGKDRAGSDSLETSARRSSSVFQSDPLGVSLTDRFRKNAKNAAKLPKKTLFQKFPSRHSPPPGMTSCSELAVEGRVVGHIFLYPGHLAIFFAKGVLMKKRDITILFRNITYQSTSPDPQICRKIVKVVLNDGSWSSSQAFVDIDLQKTNDIAEIIFKDERLRYRWCSDDSRLPMCIVPLHTGVIRDDDTACFSDGGSLTIELLAGGGKGDILMMLSEQQQVEQIQRQEAINREQFPFFVDNAESFVFPFQEDDKVFKLSSGAQCSLQYLKNQSGSQDIKIIFGKDQPFVTMSDLSYILSCIAYMQSGADKYKEGIRSFQIKLTDASNPADGKEKFSIDVRLPLLSQPLNIYLEKGVSFPLCKLQLNCLELPFTMGSVSVQLLPSSTSLSAPDKLTLAMKDSGFRTEQNGTLLLQGPNVMGILIVEPQLIKVTFTSSSKIKGNNIIAILKCIQLRLNNDNTTILVSLSEDLSCRVSSVTLGMKTKE